MGGGKDKIMNQDKENQTKLDRWFARNWEHYRNEVGTNIAKDQMFQYRDDLCVECFEWFNKRTMENKMQMYNDGKILNFLLKCASLQLKSGTSPFYGKYRKKRMHQVPDYYIPMGEGYDPEEETLDEMYQCVMNALEDESIDWYLRKILKMKYIEGLTYAQITEKYGIHNHSMKKHLDEAIDAIRNACIEFDN